MGVRGLTTYINQNHEIFLKRYFLHDSNLVIDGDSLCCQLYCSTNCNSAFGGDYDKFAIYIKNFFKSMRKCNITPYVIFDGSYETRKLKTVYSRLRSKIYGASRLDPVTQSTLRIFPLFLKEVFKEVLVEIEVAYTTTEFEADEELASLARYLECPVLSYDSDFFIYNVVYIPFNTLDINVKHIEIDGKKNNSIECKVFKVEYLVNQFGGLDKDLLPLLATLLGNDYVEKRVFQKFFSELKLSKNRQNKNDQQRSIHALFKWLQNETLDSAITKIIGRLKKKDKNHVFDKIVKGIDGYNGKFCRSIKYFKLEKSSSSKPKLLLSDIDHYNKYDDESFSAHNSSDEIDCDESDNESLEESSNCSLVHTLPEWVVACIRNDTFNRSYINLYVHHVYFCSPQAEDYSDDDAFLCALPILRFAFDILTDFTDQNFIYVCRQKEAYQKNIVNQEFLLLKIFDQPYEKLASEDLKKYVFHFLSNHMPQLDLGIINTLPQNFQLFVIALLWWVQKCKVTLAEVHSLFLTYVMLEVIDEKIGIFRSHYAFNKKYSTKIGELKSKDSCVNHDDELIFLNKNKVHHEDCLLAADVLLKHFDIDPSIKKKPKSYDRKKMHSFAQFQCCLQQFNYLNKLCCNAFESTKISKCLNGIFLYNISLKLENQSDPVGYVEHYLSGATTVLLFYKSLCNIYRQCTEKISIITRVKISKHSRKKNKKTDLENEINNIMKSLESEVFI